jgi:hypothetical protein
MPGLGGLLTQTWVPQLAQKYRTRGVAKSSRWKVSGVPFVQRKFASEITTEALAKPPDK